MVSARIQRRDVYDPATLCRGRCHARREIVSRTPTARQRRLVR
ncbi:hypothetical protein [Halomicrobium sp. IBSBa]|nr:hypothetical protein [Halomicrobium sp. IBSBa]